MSNFNCGVVVMVILSYVQNSVYRMGVQKLVSRIRDTVHVKLPDAADSPTEVFAGEVRTWVDITTVKAQEVGEAGRERRRRPVAAVAAAITHRAAGDAARIDEVVRIGPNSGDSSLTGSVGFTVLIRSIIRRSKAHNA